MVGSDVHGMLALNRRFCQVVVAYEVFDGSNVIGQRLGKRQRTAYQTRHPLPQGVVEPLDVIGLARFFVDGSVCGPDHNLASGQSECHYREGPHSSGCLRRR